MRFGRGRRRRRRRAHWPFFRFLINTLPPPVPVNLSGSGVLVASGPIADITALIAQLGGNAAVPAFYDGRLNVTASGGVASLWQDARGAGFGPNLTASGTAQPSYVGTDHLVFDGVNNQMASAAVAAFDLSHPISLVFVASAASAVAGQNMGAISDTTANNILDAQFETGPDWGSFCGGSAHSAEVASSDGVIRVLVLTYNGTAHTVQVPNHTVTSATVTAAASASRPLTLGTYTSGQSKCPSTQYAVIVYAGILSAPQVTDILNWAVANRGAVAAS